MSNVVLGPALALLAVSLEVPRAFDELLTAMRSLLLFLISFDFSPRFWLSHYAHNPRYALPGARSIQLNFEMIFLVLCSVYPMRYLFSIFADAGFHP